MLKFKNGAGKHETKSEMILIKATNERFLVHYQLEEKEKDLKLFHNGDI